MPASHSEASAETHSELDFKALCSWIVGTCDPQKDSVGLTLFSGGEWEEKEGKYFSAALKAFGFAAAPASDCTVLLAVDVGLRRKLGENCSDLLARFKSSNLLKKIFFFCLPNRSMATFRDQVLDIRANLLDASIFLPKKFFLRRIETQFSLLILDGKRNDDGRTNVTFIDASHLPLADLRKKMDSGDAEGVRSLYDNVFKDYPKAEKDFREIFILKESLLAFQHCTGQALRTVLQKQHTFLSDCADIVKSPPFLHLKEGDMKSIDTVELSCLSPRDYAPFGYTRPRSSPEKKAFPKDKIEEQHRLKPHDILLVAQRNIGKICIIDPDFSEHTWTGASFTYIIRPKGHLDARVLYMYLASDMVRQYLTTCAVGGGIPMLPVKVLKTLPVPVFTTEQAEMITDFDVLDTANRTISEITAQVSAILHKDYGAS